ncbi:MAG TPA: PAS domain S-box protein [Bacteroidales bacterium]
MQILLIIIFFLLITIVILIIKLQSFRKKTASASLLEETPENLENLNLEKYTKTLEKLVKEKTFELEQNNQELLTLNEELDAANEELQANNDELNSINEELNNTNTILQHEIEGHKKTQAEKSIVEEKLNKFISQSSEAIVIINEKGIVEDWNDTMTQITGVTKEGALGSFIWDVTYMMAFDPDKAELLRESFKKNTIHFFEEIRKGNSKEQVSETQIRHHDSSHRYIRTTLFPIFTESGYYGGVIISDITQKKAIEAQLETYRNELEMLLEEKNQHLEQLSDRLNEVYTYSSDAITFMDILDEGNTIRVFDLNPVSKKLFKISDEQLLNGVDITELLPKIKIDSFRQHILPKLLAGNPVTFTEDRDTGNGYWNSTIYPVKGETGKVHRIAAFSRNVTAEYEKNKTQAILNSAVNSWPYEFWVTDDQGRVILQNKASIEIWGDLSGQPIDVLDIPEETKQFTKEKVQLGLHGEHTSTELVFDTPKGKRYVMFNIHPVFQNDKITGILGMGIDITELKTAEENIRKSEANYRLLAENIEDVIWKMDIETMQYTFITPSIYKLSGFTVEEAMAQSLEDMVSPESLEYAKTNIAERLQQYYQGNLQNITQKNEIELKCKNGSFVWVEVNSTLVADESGKLKEIFASSRNITERKIAEKKIKESEEKFRTIFNSATDGIILLDNNLKIMDINRASYEKTGYQYEELVHNTIFTLLSKEGINIIQRQISALKSGGIVLNFETEIFIKNDGVIPVEVIATNINISKQEAILLIARDISERKKLERELLNSVINTEEKDRLQFSQELHDGIGPLLSAAKMYADWLAESNTDPKIIVPEIQKLINESTLAVRDLSFKLSPHILQNYGIIEALKTYADKVNKSGKVKVSVESTELGRFDEIIETTLYRTISECITNTLKHANAKNISICPVLENNTLMINYTDDGKGFDVEKVMKNRKGIGLLNIQSRLKSLNGTLAINSTLGKGTVFIIKIPLSL